MIRGIDSSASPWTPAAVSRADALGVGERREERDEHLAVVEPRRLVGARRRDLDDHVAAPRIADRRAGVGVRRVREAGLDPCALLDDDLDALPETADGLGDERHPTFAGRRLLWYSDSHRRARRYRIGPLVR